MSHVFNPSLLPLAAIAYSVLNSWHCALMCGSICVGGKREHMHRLFLYRIVSYSAVGALMGAFGSVVRDSLEYQAFSAIGFLMLSLMTIAAALPILIPTLARKQSVHHGSSIMCGARGLMMGLIPCHILAFYYGIAALGGSALLGGALLATHAIVTTPCLAFPGDWLSRIARLRSPWRLTVRIVLVALLALNFLGFAWPIFQSEPAHLVRLICGMF